jgi:hypothetical protein
MVLLGEREFSVLRAAMPVAGMCMHRRRRTGSDRRAL